MGVSRGVLLVVSRRLAAWGFRRSQTTPRYHGIGSRVVDSVFSDTVTVLHVEGDDSYMKRLAEAGGAKVPVNPNRDAYLDAYEDALLRRWTGHRDDGSVTVKPEEVQSVAPSGLVRRVKDVLVAADVPLGDSGAAVVAPQGAYVTAEPGHVRVMVVPWGETRWDDQDAVEAGLQAMGALARELGEAVEMEKFITGVVLRVRQ